MTHTYIDHPTKWGYIKCSYLTEIFNYYIILPMHSGGTNYIIYAKGLIHNRI